MYIPPKALSETVLPPEKLGLTEPAAIITKTSVWAMRHCTLACSA